MNFADRDNYIRDKVLEEGLPNRRDAIRGIDADEFQVFALWTVAQKLYRCQVCRYDLEIGEEHALVRTSEEKDGFDHHHQHFECFRAGTLPAIGRLAIVKASEASGRNNARPRRRR